MACLRKNSKMVAEQADIIQVPAMKIFMPIEPLWKKSSSVSTKEDNSGQKTHFPLQCNSYRVKNVLYGNEECSMRTFRNSFKQECAGQNNVAIKIWMYLLSIGLHSMIRAFNLLGYPEQGIIRNNWWSGSFVRGPT